MERYTTRISRISSCLPLWGGYSLMEWHDLWYDNRPEMRIHYCKLNMLRTTKTTSLWRRIYERRLLGTTWVSGQQLIIRLTQARYCASQSSPTYQYNSFFVSANLAFNLIKNIRLTENCRWAISQSKSGNYTNTIRNFSNEAALSIAFIPDRLILNTNLQYTHNSGFTDKKDYTFMNLSITFKTKKEDTIRSERR